MIELENVSVQFDDQSIITDISAAVAGGEILGIIGPNGAGKTTLLRTMAGILTPDTGTIELQGDEIAGIDRKALSRRVAMVPQTTELSFGFPVRDVVAMGRTPYRQRFRDRDPGGRGLVESALERTDTTHLADRPVTELSGGEHRRVLLARALAQDTPILLLDEPTANLDINHQIRTFELVDGLIDEDRTAIVAVHDLDLAARYCDRLLLLSDGQSLAIGSPTDVLRNELVESAFGIRVAIRDDPVTGSRSVTPLPDRDTPPGVCVAVLGGGDQLNPTLRRLDRAGYDVTVGLSTPRGRVVDVADALDIEVVTYSGEGTLSNDDWGRMRAVIEHADVTVVTGGSWTSRTMALAGAARRLIMIEDHANPAEQADEAVARRYRALRSAAIVTSSERIQEAVAAALTEDKKPRQLSDREV